LVVLDVLDVVLEQRHRLSASGGHLLEVQQGLEVEPVQPDPFRPVVVAETMGCDVVIGVVIVVVVLAVQRLVYAIERPYTDRIVADEARPYNL